MGVSSLAVTTVGALFSLGWARSHEKMRLPLSSVPASLAAPVRRSRRRRYSRMATPMAESSIRPQTVPSSGGTKLGTPPPPPPPPG